MYLASMADFATVLEREAGGDRLARLHLDEGWHPVFADAVWGVGQRSVQLQATECRVDDPPTLH